jgi:hypothetical protein
MAQLDTRGVHVFRKDKKSNRWYHAETHPIQWFCSEGGRFAVQDGVVWTASGVRVPAKEQPQWLTDAIAALSPAHRASLGLKDTGKPN